MSTALRKLLVILIALVIPLQGFASVAGLRCATSDGHRDSHSVSPQHDPQQGHALHDHGTHEHATPAASDHHHDNGGAHSHCGPCAACCAAAFISGAPPALVFPAASSGVVAFVLPPAHAINPEPLDRPPLAL